MSNLLNTSPLLSFLLMITCATAYGQVAGGCGKAKNDADIAKYTKAIEFSEYDYNAIVKRGAAHRENSDHAAALKDFNHAIELNPRAETAYLERGRLFSQRASDDWAISDFTKAIELNPFNPEPYHELAVTQWGVETEQRTLNLSAAISNISKAIELSPGEGYLYSERFASLSLANQKQEAAADLNKALEMVTGEIARGVKRPCHRDLYIERAYIYQSLRRYDDALKDVNIAIANHPNYFRGYLRRGIIFMLQQKHEKAIADYTRAIELSPNFVNTYMNRASEFVKLGQKEKGAADRQKIKDLRNSVPGAQPDP